MSLSHKFITANQDSLNEQFLEAVRANETDRARHYVETGANINVRDAKGDTALLTAARSGFTDMGLMLVGKKASLDAKGERDGATALSVSARRGDLKLSAALIDADADITIEDRDGKKALDYAMKAGEPQMIALFEKPLKKLIDRIPSSALAQKLRAEHANVDEVDPVSGKTMLTWAAGRTDQTNIAVAFLEAGADPQKRDRNGQSPIDVARESGNAQMLQILEAAQRQRPAQGKTGGEMRPLFPPRG